MDMKECYVVPDSLGNGQLMYLFGGDFCNLQDFFLQFYFDRICESSFKCNVIYTYERVKVELSYWKNQTAYLCICPKMKRR